jgi:hypothetical protein
VRPARDTNWKATRREQIVSNDWYLTAIGDGSSGGQVCHYSQISGGRMIFIMNGDIGSSGFIIVPAVAVVGRCCLWGCLLLCVVDSWESMTTISTQTMCYLCIQFVQRTDLFLKCGNERTTS